MSSVRLVAMFAESLFRVLDVTFTTSGFPPRGVIPFLCDGISDSVTDALSIS